MARPFFDLCWKLGLGSDIKKEEGKSLIDSMDADEDACCVCVFVLLILPPVLDQTALRKVDHGRCYARSDAVPACRFPAPWMDGRT
jgi:hypothetical protein